MTAAVPDPALLARLGDLELVARIIVEGLVSGLHRSPFHGYSAEFSQYRHYQPGDDLKYVDWKLAARTDRVYTKQYRETTNMPSAIVLDASRSMDFPDGPHSKFRYAVIAAAALAHLVSRQGDAVGLVIGERFHPSRTGHQHLRHLLAALASSTAASTWRPADAIRLAAERLGRRGLLLVLSDLYDDEEAAFAELRRASRRGHEVALLHVMSRDEIEFAYRGPAEFVDLESGRALSVDAAVARRGYLDAMASFLERWRARAGSEGFQYALMTTDTPHARALRSFLLARAG